MQWPLSAVKISPISKSLAPGLIGADIFLQIASPFRHNLNKRGHGRREQSSLVKRVAIKHSRRANKIRKITVALRQVDRQQ